MSPKLSNKTDHITNILLPHSSNSYVVGYGVLFLGECCPPFRKNGTSSSSAAKKNVSSKSHRKRL